MFHASETKYFTRLPFSPAIRYFSFDLRVTEILAKNNNNTTRRAHDATGVADVLFFSVTS